MAKFNLVWENNPDTPITASNLSKAIREYEYKNILYMDTNDFINNGDGLLKIRANSRIVLNNHITSAFFDFNNSLVSHDSKISAMQTDAINYRIETPRNDGYSLALETETQNRVQNADFSDNLNSWDSSTLGTASVNISNGGLYGDNCVILNVAATNSRALISQSIQFDPTPSYEQNKNTSISFYYKSDSAINVLITGKYNSAQPIYWNNDPTKRLWELSSATAVLTLNPSTNWKRVEIKNIRTDSLWINDTSTNDIKLDIFSSDSGTTTYIDGVQIEQKQFCSTFTPSTRNETIIKYNSDIIRMDRGTIDVEFLVKKLSAKNIIFRVKMNPVFNSVSGITYTDAMRLDLDSSTYTINFYIFNTEAQEERRLNKTLSQEAFNNLIDKWNRIILTWDKDKPFIKFTFNSDGVNSTSLPFTPISDDDVVEVELGGYNEFKMEGLLSSIKFNIYPKSEDDIINDSYTTPYPDPCEYKIFESPNDSITIDKNLLDVGDEFSGLTEYYIYLYDCEGLQDSVDIIVSDNPIAPYESCKKFAKQIAGFKTDSTGKPIISSLWDKKTKSAPTIMAERLLIHGKDSSINNVEIRTSPYGDVSDAKFNIPTYFTDNIYGVAGQNNFFNINPAGHMTIDNIKFDDNVITAINDKNLLVKAPSDKKIQIEANEIDINSLGSNIYLDEVIVKGQQIRASSTKNLTITNDTVNPSSELIIQGHTGIVRIDGINYINQSVNNTVNGSVVDITGSNIVTITGNDIDVNSGIGEIQLDDVRIKSSIIKSKLGANLTLANDTQNSEVIINGYSGISRISGENHINNATTTTFNGQNLITEATSTQIKSNATNPVYIDNISFRTNTISSKVGADLRISSNMAVQVDSPMRFNSPTQKIFFSTGVSGVGTQNASVYNRTQNHFMWYKNGAHSDSPGVPGTGGSTLALLSSNETSSALGITIDPNSRFYAGRVHGSVWNDYAECWPKEGEVEYGQVVVRTENGVIISSKRAQKATIGIVSDTYGHLLGDDGFDPDLKKSKVIPIGLAGRVKAKSHGKLRIGDEVVSWKGGMVIKASWFEKVFKRDRIIGMVDSVIDVMNCWIKIR